MTNDKDRIQNATDDINLAIALNTSEDSKVAEYLKSAKRWLEETQHKGLMCNKCGWRGEHTNLYRQKCPECGSKSIWERSA